MDHVIRAAIVYLFLLVLFRISGKRTLAEVTTFDFILLLIISEAAQQALLGQDYSFTAAAIVISTLVGLDMLLAWISTRSEKIQKLLDSVPLVIVEEGKPIKERMKKSGVDETEILQTARELQGIASLDQIKYAVLERSGGITVIPYSEQKSGRK
jgi:uncharacterized membrane protein YcaP (DUF421 family)